MAYTVVSFLSRTESTEKDNAGNCECHCSNRILNTETGSQQLTKRNLLPYSTKIRATHINHLSSVSWSFLKDKWMKTNADWIWWAVNALNSFCLVSPELKVHSTVMALGLPPPHPEKVCMQTNPSFQRTKGPAIHCRSSPTPSWLRQHNCEAHWRWHLPSSRFWFQNCTESSEPVGIEYCWLMVDLSQNCWLCLPSITFMLLQKKLLHLS